MKQVLGEPKRSGRSNPMHVAVAQHRMMELVGRPKHAVEMEMSLASEPFEGLNRVNYQPVSMMGSIQSDDKPQRLMTNGWLILAQMIGFSDAGFLTCSAQLVRGRTHRDLVLGLQTGRRVKLRLGRFHLHA